MMTRYWPAVTISLLMHGALFAVLIWGAQFAPKKTLAPPPTFIKASLVSVEAASKPKVTQPKKETPKKAQPKPPPKKVDLTKQRQEQERLQKLAAEKKKKDQLAKQQAEQAAKEKQAKIERDKTAKLAAEKAAQEKAEEEARKKAEQEQLRLQAVQERKKQEQDRLRKEQQQALLDDIAKEKAQLDAEIAAERVVKQAAEDEEAKQSYSALIQKRITDAWSRPPSARKNMIVELTIELIPTGEVINVNVTDSSGNAAFDRSAVRAVNRVGGFPELREMSRRLFDAEFRSFKLNFSPEDLRQ